LLLREFKLIEDSEVLEEFKNQSTDSVTEDRVTGGFMAICSMCGRKMKSKSIQNADLIALGIPVLITSGISNFFCKQCNATELSVPNLPGLIAAAAVSLAGAPYKLNASEIRFLRKALGSPAKVLAESLDVAPETVSRWENDKQSIGDAQERLLRLQIVSKLSSQAPGLAVTLEDVLSLKISPFRDLADQPVLSYERSPQGGLPTLHSDEGLYQRSCL
jgi:DNA-binding transcriptional regulator YiaG